MLAFSGFFSSVERCANGLCSRNCSDFVCDDDTKHLRPAGRSISLNICRTRKCLNNGVIDTLVCVRTLLSKPTYRDINQAGVELSEDRLAKTHALHSARPEVLNQHICIGNQVKQDFLAVFRLEVNTNRSLAAITGEKCGRDLIDRRPDMTHLLAGGGLYFDDVGALVGQHHGRNRARYHTRQIQHFDAR